MKYVCSFCIGVFYHPDDLERHQKYSAGCKANTFEDFVKKEDSTPARSRIINRNLKEPLSLAEVDTTENIKKEVWAEVKEEFKRPENKPKRK